VKCSCLNQVAHSKGISNLLSRIMIEDWGLERERESWELKILNLRECFRYVECPLKEEGWRSIYSLHTIITVGNQRTGLVR
jgi:hypothetical protein